ncbi:MAG: hypothetical protein ABFC28_09070 [Rikenellaceae bacterium]
MHFDFSSEFRKFLDNLNIEYSEKNSLFNISKPAISVRLIKLNNASESTVERANITLYEDEWYTKFPLISNRLLANLGRQNTIFARNCTIQQVSAGEARCFLDRNHILGFTKSHYKYGLFTTKRIGDMKNGEMVAVAMFSAPRPMEREGLTVQSYEWVRYASIANYRVVGGMGKLMSYFVESQSPDEIMTYADKDWGNGDVYRKLGFVYQCETEPIEFFVNRSSYERVSIKKLLSAQKCNTQEQITKEYVLLRNQGNLKFLWRFPLTN